MKLDEIKTILKSQIEKAESISELYTICDMGKECCYHSNND